MDYTFEIITISPILDFFNCQQQFKQKQLAGAEYLGSYRCTLDSFLATLETVPPRQGWHLDRVIDTVIDFWLNNAEQISHWKRRLEDAGTENLLVARVADLKALRAEFEFLLDGDRS